MTKIFTSLIFLLGFLQHIQTQTVERSLTAGSRSEAVIVKPYGEDKWLIAGRGVPEPGATGRDTLFIAILNHEGQIQLRKNLTLPVSAIHDWYDVLALPDGGIIASFESRPCDLVGIPPTVQRLDIQGNLVWELSSSTDLEIPEKWHIAPTGNLIGASNTQVWNVEVNTGDVLARIDLEGINTGDNDAYKFHLIPDSEDFFAFGNPDIQLWHKYGSSSFPKYKMINSLDSLGSIHDMKSAPDGWFYYLNYLTVERINYNLQQEVVFQPSILPDPNLGFEISGSNLFYTIGQNSIFLNKFDLQSQQVSTVLSWESRRRLRSIAARNGWLALFGSEMLGEIDATPWFAQSSAAWISTFPETSTSAIGGLSNAAVVDIEQVDPIDTVVVNIPNLGNFYNVFGGRFKIKLTNQGSKVLDNVNVNIAFGRNYYFDFCFLYSTQQKRFSNLNLPVGESIWIDFGDIQAEGQTAVPAEICFWTSSPNEEPDANYENDRACHPASYTVSTKDPKITQVILSPNPADDFTELALSEKMEGEPWQIFDAAGRVVSSGVCTAGNILRIETAQLPSGFYLLRLKNRVGKLVVQH